MRQILRDDLEFVLSVPLVIEYEKVAIVQQDSMLYSSEEIRDYLDYLEKRAKRGSRKKFEDIMDRVPDVEPEEYDRF